MLTPIDLLSNHPELAHAKQLIVAYSGGMDSHVLLHCLAELQRSGACNGRLRAVHVHHGLSAQADQFVAHCIKQARALAVPLQVLYLHLKPQRGESIEACARAARYRAFSPLLDKDDVILTAHHERDQAETVLLQMLRGAGPQGLAAMGSMSALGKGWHSRPLLPMSHEDLLAYAKAHRLAWIDDNSNEDTRFDRNFLRQRIMPLLRQRWPGIDSTFSRTASHCANAETLLNRHLDNELNTLVREDKTLAIQPLLAYCTVTQQALLRRWLARCGLQAASTAQLRQCLDCVLKARSDGQPILRWSGQEIRRYDNHLYAIAQVNSHDPNAVIVWPDWRAPLALPHQLGSLTSTYQPAGGIAASHLLSGHLTVRFRQGGERFWPLGRCGSHPLKKLLQEARVPPWCRDRVPLVYINETLAYVVGLAVAAPLACQSGDHGVAFSLTPTSFLSCMTV